MIHVITLMPGFFKCLQHGISKRALKTPQLRLWNPRWLTPDHYGQVDDKPFGGGSGQILTYPAIKNTLNIIQKKYGTLFVVIFAPRGTPIKQDHIHDIHQQKHCVLICGRYDGFDERIYDEADIILSHGDFITSGGEYPASACIDALFRSQDGILGNAQCLKNESFSGELLDHPQYTRPFETHGKKTPEILCSGDPKAIEAWRASERKRLTKLHRPDLARKA